MTKLHSCASALRPMLPVSTFWLWYPSPVPEHCGTDWVPLFRYQTGYSNISFILVSDWPDAGQSGILAFKKHSTVFAVNLLISLETNTVCLQKILDSYGAKSASSRIEIRESLSEEICEFWLTEGSVLYNCMEENPSIHYFFLYGGIYCDFRHPTRDYG
jgi:hypothetical protein